MFIKVRKFIVFSIMSLILIAGVLTANAYNAKFSYSIKSGWWSPWKYSDYGWKYSEDQNPVVNCTYSEGSTSYFEYTVVNSNFENRVRVFGDYCTFNTREFNGNITEQGYRYQLGVKRRGGAWNSEARAQGQWNIDSY